MKLSHGDSVIVTAGKDKGKSGKVIRVLPEVYKVVVENINLHTKFEKSKTAGKPGQKVVMPSPMPVSKVMLVDSASGKPTRVGYKILENGIKQRIAKVSGKAV
jgi:large subunit ribosomal protein L24